MNKIVFNSEAGIYDRVVVQDLIKSTAQSVQLNSDLQKPFKGKTLISKYDIVIIINEADKLSREAQHALRRTMEKYSHICRLILISESLSSIIQPVQSRCLCLRVSLPTEKSVYIKIRKN